MGDYVIRTNPPTDDNQKSVSENASLKEPDRKKEVKNYRCCHKVPIQSSYCHLPLLLKFLRGLPSLLAVILIQCSTSDSSKVLKKIDFWALLQGFSLNRLGPGIYNFSKLSG